MEEQYKEKITRVYAEIKALRAKGAKMKDISECFDITSSVLSALYSTVMPAIFDAMEKGAEFDGSIDEALDMVNNVSKRKFLGIVDIIYSKLDDINISSFNNTTDDRIYFGDIQKEAANSMAQASNYSGIYMSYSRTSYKDALKAEPYLIKKLDKGEIMPRVCFKNSNGQEFWGVGLFSVHQIGHIFINEQRNKRLGLRNISLQLPLFDKPKVLKGIYLSHDFNHNPIARRIIFIKLSDSDSETEFNNYSPSVITAEEFTKEEREFYEYTCLDGDYIRSMMYYSPEQTDYDLKMEKMMLNLK